MNAIRGHFRAGQIVLSQPLDLPDGVEIEVVVHPVDEPSDEEWHELGMKRLEEEWDNPGDAIYDDWRPPNDVSKS